MLRKRSRSARFDAASVESGDQRLFCRAGVTIGEFVCRPRSEMWARENQISAGHLIVFPRCAVEIEPAGGSPVVADPTHVMLYNDGQVYRRRLLDTRGDEAVFFALPPALIAEIVGERDPGVGERLEAPFRFSQGPVSAREYLAHARLFHALVDVGDAGSQDTLEIDEQLVELLTQTLAQVYAARGRERRERGRAGSRTRRQHLERVHELRRVLAPRFTESHTLAELAAEVGLSPFHAARIFRRYTGSSLHAYRVGLRLRSSLHRLARGHSEGLTGVALELGFASHSHFTAAFSKEFGVPPSHVWGRRRPTILP